MSTEATAVGEKLYRFRRLVCDGHDIPHRIFSQLVSVYWVIGDISQSRGAQWARRPSGNRSSAGGASSPATGVCIAAIGSGHGFYRFASLFFAASSGPPTSHPRDSHSQHPHKMPRKLTTHNGRHKKTTLQQHDDVVDLLSEGKAPRI
jgi:hypothetical protein